MEYGTGQRVAFAGLVIGFLMCASGAIAPFWQEGSISMNTVADIFKEHIPFNGDAKLITIYGGLWWYCADVLGQRKCEVYNFSGDSQATDLVVRIACVVNVLLTLLCALVALCRSCCCGGGKTICHGIIAFFAGGAGILAGGMFAGTSQEGFNLSLIMPNYGWAFYIYIIGAVIVTFVSFMLCFASPNNPFTPVIMNSVNHILPNNRYTQMSDERVLVEESGRDAQYYYPHANRPQSLAC